MKKVISTALAVLLTVLCGCNAHRQSKKIVKAPKSDVTYTVALNPSVMFSDGEVESLRNSAAASMPKDIKAKRILLFIHQHRGNGFAEKTTAGVSEHYVVFLQCSRMIKNHRIPISLTMKKLPLFRCTIPLK